MKKKQQDIMQKQIKDAIQAELERASELYPKHESLEESYIVLKREFCELEYECLMYQRSLKDEIDATPEEVRKDVIEEAIQVAAMARRMVEDAGLRRYHTEGLTEYRHKQIDTYLGMIFSKMLYLLLSLTRYPDRDEIVRDQCMLIEHYIVQMLINTGIWRACNGLEKK